MTTAPTTHIANFEHLKFDVDPDGIATLLLDIQGESINTLSPKLNADLAEAIRTVENDSTIKAVVLSSAKPSGFIAGADINILGEAKTLEEATELSTHGQAGMAQIEALHTKLNKPVVAAIHGPALGGGLELALACSIRVISNSPKTILGLPEVKLGLLPGAGGTQRLPRLIGIAKALDMMLTGKNIRPKKALAIGLADEAVPEPILLKVAKKRALEAATGDLKPPRGLKRLKALATEVTDSENLQQLALEENPVGLRVLFKQAYAAMMKQTLGNYPAAEKILEAVRKGAFDGIEAGYSAETKGFGELVMSNEAAAQMSIFFGTQSLKKDTGIDTKIKPKPVARIGVLGAGLMGAGIATVSITQAKTPARLKDLTQEGVEKGLQYVRSNLNKDLKRKIKSLHEVNRTMTMLTGCTNMSGMEQSDIVIEAVFEDVDLKRKVLAEIEAACGPKTIFASNTSSLPIGDIAAEAQRPENVIGMHYFSPVEKMPLLEIITTEKTADWVTATCVQEGKKQGKIVIVVRDGTGFYTSRILAPFMNEAAWAIKDGATVEQLDNAMIQWGFPVGPMTLLDEVGIDVGQKVAGIMEEAFGARVKTPEAMKALLDDDRKGRKNGRGFYLYENGKKGGVDKSVYKTLGLSGKEKKVDIPNLQNRVALQMVNEAARCLEEEILRSPRDGDMGAIFGLGFPPFRGGPFFHVDTVGVGQVVDDLKRFEQEFGKRFAPAQILQDYAAQNKKFRR